MNPPEIPPPIPPVLPERSTEPNSIRFSLSRLDVLWCRLWVIAQSRTLLVFTLAPCVIVGLTTLSAPEIREHGFLVEVFAFCFAAGIFLFFSIFVQVVIHGIMIVVRKNSGVVGDHVFELREDGLFERTDVSEGLFRWAGISKIRCAGNFLFIYVGGNMVHYIPRRIFPSVEAFQGFRAEIERRVKAARGR